jgi:hypothetical protein
MGAAFAPMNWADLDRAQSYSNALRRGVQDAQNQRFFEREAARDDDFLRSMGFGGPSNDYSRSAAMTKNPTNEALSEEIRLGVLGADGRISFGQKAPVA